MKSICKINEVGMIHYIFIGWEWNMQAKKYLNIKLNFNSRKIKRANIYVYDDFFEPTQYLFAEPNGGYILRLNDNILSLIAKRNGIFNTSKFSSNFIKRLRIDIWI